MTDRDRSLLSVIEQDLLGDTASTTSVLQKCIILGGRIGSTDLRDWARKELSGYAGEAVVPHYRIVPAQMCIDGQAGNARITGENIGPEDLPDFVREAGIDNEVTLRNGIGELEALARSDESGMIRFQLPQSSIIVKMMNAKLESPFQHIDNVYWRVRRETIQGVVDQIRTALAELVSELLHLRRLDQATPSKEQTDQAVHFAVTGERAQVTFTNSQAARGSTSTVTTSTPAPVQDESWWKRWRKRGIVIGIFSMCGATAGVLNYLQVFPWN